MKRYFVGAFLILVFVVILGLSLAFEQHWWAVHSGTCAPDIKMCRDQVYYNFWSGFGSDLGEATLVSAVGVGVYTAVRKINCHTKGCWRIGHHPLDGTPYTLCKHHHPDVPTEGASHEHILEHHRRVVEARTPKPRAVAKKTT